MRLPRPGGRAGAGRRVLARARAVLVLLAAAATVGILTTAPATAAPAAAAPVELPDLPVLLRSGSPASAPHILDPEECAWLQTEDPGTTGR